jgi:hypothetical protein
VRAFVWMILAATAVFTLSSMAGAALMARWGLGSKPAVLGALLQLGAPVLAIAAFAFLIWMRRRRQAGRRRSPSTRQAARVVPSLPVMQPVRSARPAQPSRSRARPASMRPALAR